MEHLDTLMRSAAHDIRGYLASASLATEQLSTHTDARVARSAERISFAIEQVVSICRNDLVESDGAEVTTYHSAQAISSLLEQITTLIAPQFEKCFRPTTISINVADDVSIDCHSSNLFRILYNLSVNAAHAIVAYSGSLITLKVARNGNRICFLVADDGPGLPKHIIDHLHSRNDHPVQKTKRVGYGLTSAVSLATTMQGALHLIESSPSGTKFCVVLPDKIW